MKAKLVVGIAAATLVACCLYTHRRVIKAVVNHEPMPKAPKWHVWVKPEGRKE